MGLRSAERGRRRRLWTLSWTHGHVAREKTAQGFLSQQPRFDDDITNVSAVWLVCLQPRIITHREGSLKIGTCSCDKTFGGVVVTVGGTAVRQKKENGGNHLLWKGASTKTVVARGAAGVGRSPSANAPLVCFFALSRSSCRALHSTR